MSRVAYVGKITNSNVDFKTIVMAENGEDAKLQVVEKYKEDIGKLFNEEDIQIQTLF